jgi:cellulose synthase/poly-beta-1,6-N-acetylglucosamine synthase-like glycosyltransferase
MNATVPITGLWSALCSLPTLDAVGRLARLWAYRGRRDEEGAAPRRLLVLVPSRAEGLRVGGLVEDLARERRESDTRLDVVVILDGEDAEAARRVRGAGFEALVKMPPGPSKGTALAFATAHLTRTDPERLDAADFVVVLDADTRLPQGWLRSLRAPAGTEVFQLPVLPERTPAAGAARVEALSLAIATRVEDMVRDARAWPVRLRGKAMGFSPQAWRSGPARASRTLVEDSEVTLTLLASGFRIRALPGPAALEEPAAGSGSMAHPRARWFAGHIHLLAVGSRDLLAAARRSPLGTLALAADLFLRPRALVLAFLAATAASAAALVAGGFLPALIPLSIAVLGLCAEALYVRAARRLIGPSPDVPAVRAADLGTALLVWLRAIGLAIVSPRRWHRARPEVVSG